MLVRRRKLQRPQLLARHPAHLLTLLRRRLTPDLTTQKVKLDSPIGVIVRCCQKLDADFCADVQLFAKLSRHARGERFSGVTFAAGKFPVAREMHAGLPSRDEKSIAPFDHRGRDDDCDHLPAAGLKGNARQPFDIGQTGHLGFLATQTMAPKSISAWLKSKTCRMGTSVSESFHRCRFMA